MIPYSKISIGDIYSNPAYRNLGEYSGLEWFVVDRDDTEKLISIQACSFLTGLPVGMSIWKTYKDRMFCEQWKISGKRG